MVTGIKIKFAIILLISSLAGCTLFYTEYETAGTAKRDDAKSKELSKISKEALSEGNILEAAEAAREAWDSNKSDTSVYLDLARTLARSGDIFDNLEAIMMMDDITSKFPGDIVLLQTKIDILNEIDWRLLKTFGFIERTYLEILDVDSTNLEALWFVGRFNYEYWQTYRHSKSKKANAQQSYEKALKAFRVLANYHRNFAPGVNALIQIYQDSPDLVNRIPDLVNIAVIDNPNAYQLWLNLAYFYYNRSFLSEIKDLKSAQTYFEKAFTLMDSVEIERFHDIEFLLRGDDLDRFLSAPSKTIGAKRYWNRTQVFRTHGFNLDQLTHYSRVWYAWNHFNVMGRDKPGDLTDRGKYYIRYGAPSFMVTISKDNVAIDDTVSAIRGIDEIRSNFETTTSPALSLPDENYIRWNYPEFELLFIYNSNVSDFLYFDPGGKYLASTPKSGFAYPLYQYFPIHILNHTVVKSSINGDQQLIAYFAIPINSKLEVEKPFSMRLEQGAYLFDESFDGIQELVNKIPPFLTEAVFFDYRDSAFAMQTYAMDLPSNTKYVIHELWIPNTRNIWRYQVDVENLIHTRSAFRIDHLGLVKRSLSAFQQQEGETLTKYFNFIPNFTNTVRKGTKEFLNVRLLNPDLQATTDYLIEYTLERFSEGIFSQVTDALLQRNTSISINYTYQNKPAVFENQWDLGTDKLIEGNYRIILECIDQNSKARDRKEITFQVVN